MTERKQDRSLPGEHHVFAQLVALNEEEGMTRAEAIRAAARRAPDQHRDWINVINQPAADRAA